MAAWRSDVDFIPQDLPDPARPNGVLAPYWTDLDGTGAEGIRAGTLTDGVNTWIVLQWDVVLFGTTSARAMQIWIGIDGVEDITYGYDVGTLGVGTPAGYGLTVGAENPSGTGGADIGVAAAGSPSDVELPDHDDAGSTRRDVHLHAHDPRRRQGQPLADDVDDGDHGGRYHHGVDGDRRHQEVGGK